jgi:hypothetical protein
MPPRLPLGRHLAGFLRQLASAVLALFRQSLLHRIHFGGGQQGPMMSRVARLATGLPFALVLAAARSLLASQPVGGRWLGRIRRVALAQRQLPLQVRDLLLGVRDLLLGVRDLLLASDYFTPELLVLATQPVIFTLQVLPAGRLGLPMAVRRYLGLPSVASRSRTHPPYVIRFRSKCPAKSTGIPELLRLLSVIMRTDITQTALEIPKLTTVSCCLL